MNESTLGMSLVLSATPAKSVLPRSVGSSDEVVCWSGRGLEGMVRCVAESEGTVVPETAMSLREPPWGLGSEGGDIFCLRVLCGDWEVNGWIYKEDRQY